MLRVTDRQLDLFSRCPKKLFYNLANPQVAEATDEDAFIRALILKAYQKQGIGRPPTWKLFCKWLERGYIERLLVKEGLPSQEQLQRCEKARN